MDIDEQAAVEELQRMIAPLQRYEVVKILGAGGVGYVALVRHKELRTLRAMKLVHGPYLRSRVMRERFIREARVMEMLRSPNVLLVYDVDTVDGMPYILMEYCSGGTIKDHMEAFGALSPRQATSVTIDVLRALAFGHTFVDPDGNPSPVYHRDIKPENVLFTKRGQVKVADYGIAKLQEGTAHLTREGTAMGTLAFMSPEQKIDASSADHRADIHAVGVMLWCLLRGEYPRSGNDFYFQREADEALLEGIPPELECVILMATAKDPDTRYQSAQEMIDELEHQMASLPEDSENLPGLGTAPKVLRERNLQETQSIHELPSAAVGSEVSPSAVAAHQKGMTIAPHPDDGPAATRAMSGAGSAQDALASHVSEVPSLPPGPIRSPPAGVTLNPWDSEVVGDATRADGGLPMGTFHEGVLETEQARRLREEQEREDRRRPVRAIALMVVVMTLLGGGFLWVISTMSTSEVVETPPADETTAIVEAVTEPLIEPTPDPPEVTEEIEPTVEVTPDPVLEVATPTEVREPEAVPESRGEVQVPVVAEVEPEVVEALASTGVDVKLTLPGGTVATVKLTGPGGTYMLTPGGQSVNVPPGVYSAFVTMEGRDTPQEGTITVAQGTPVKITCNTRFGRCTGIK